MIGSQGGFASFGGGMNNNASGQPMFLTQNGSMMLGSGGGNNMNNSNANNGAAGNPSTGLGVGMNNGGQGQVNMANVVQSQETGSSQSGADYSLAGILHYLQSEWRRYEKDRNEWEIERAEMRARIALLEGERRGIENLKTDLMRRVKMLEYALRQERSKYLSSSNPSSSSPQSAVPPLIKKPLQGLEKTSSGSGRSSPAPSQEPGHGATGSTVSFNPSTLGAGSTISSTLMNTVHSAALSGQLSRSSSSAKDPKSRAKSRDYLKQCLQEISYLTSATTLNPLPDRGFASGSSASGSIVPSSLRPRKMMLENVPPTVPRHMDSQALLSPTAGRGNAGNGPGIPNPGPGKAGRPGRSPLFASEPVLEEASEAEEEGSDRAQSHRQPTEASQLPNHTNPTFADSHAASDENNAANAEATAFSLDVDQDGFPTKQDFSNGDFADKDQEARDDSAQFPDSSGNSDSSSSTDSSRFSESQPISSGSSDDQDQDENEQVTAIFKPGGRDWLKLKEAGIKSRERREAERKDKEDEAAILSDAQQQLAITSDKVNQLMNRSGRGQSASSNRKGEDELANLSLEGEEEEVVKEAAEAAADNLLWKSKKILRSHLDAVRAVAFTPSDLGLLSASDDNTIKYWDLDSNTLHQPSVKSGTDSQPLVTFRGHSAGVTCLAISGSKRRFYSGSLDSSIRVWQLPEPFIEPYPPFRKTTELGSLVGHTQAVWDLVLLPDRSDDEGRLGSASADGTVKIWAVSNTSQLNGDSATPPAPAELQLSWDYFGIDPAAESVKERENLEKSGMLPIPTCVGLCHSDLRLVAVSYSNSVVKLFDLESGKQVRQLKSDETYDGTPGTQINKIVTHPTLPSLISAHEDGYIRMFDLDSGACTLSMVAHLDAVISLDIDASGLTLVSGGHDCSVRFWDIARESLASRDASNEAVQKAASTAVCRQEISSHRNKAGEGVLSVKYHPTAPYLASAGADGVIRIYG